MSATINIFKSAFNDNYETFAFEKNQTLKSVLDLDWNNCLISVNGNSQSEEYILKDNDIVTIRQFPSDYDSSSQRTLGIFNWVLDPVGSLVGGFVTGEWRGSLWSIIAKCFTQEKTSASETTESIPTISGGQNQSGADRVIPLILGKTFYTPNYCAQTFQTIDPSDGTDGENQYFNALYLLGYNDIDLKSVNLGIYTLSSDRKNGTSGILDCSQTSTVKTTTTQTKNIDRIKGVQGTGIVSFSYLLSEDDYKLLEVNNFTINSDFKIIYFIYRKDLDTGNSKSDYIRKTYKSTDSSITYAVNKKDDNYYLDFTCPMIEDYQFPTWTEGSGSNKHEIVITGYATYASFGIEYTAEIETVKKPHYDPDEYKINLELQQGENEVSLFPQKVVQEDFGGELINIKDTNPLYFKPFSAKYPQKVELEIGFSNLLHYDDSNNQEDDEVYIGVAYSVDGGENYLPFESFQQSSNSVKITSETKTFSTSSGYQGSYRRVKFRGCKNKQLRYIANKTFTKSEVFDCTNNAVEILIWRDSVNESYSDTKHQYTATFNSIRTWCYDYNASKTSDELVPQVPIIKKYRNMTARLGFKIKTGSELNGQIDSLNCIIQSRARICTRKYDDVGDVTYTWSKETYPTNNPASIALMVLEHQSRNQYKYLIDDSGDYPTSDIIDLDSFGEFYFHCAETDKDLDTYDGQRFICNGALVNEKKTSELIKEILTCGHGSLILNNNKYGVWIDKAQDTPVMILNNQNVLSASNTKDFEDDIDGYSVKFIDGLNDYQETTIVCVDNNAPEDSSEYKLETLELPYITDAKRVYRECMYQLACRKLRPETWVRKVGIEGNLLGIGNRVEVQDDTLSVGIGDGAEITSIVETDGYITKIVTDGKFTVSDISENYGLKITQADGVNAPKVSYYPVTITEIGIYSEFDVKISTSEKILPNVDDFVSFGILEKITTSALVFGKKDNGDGTFQLTLKPYVEDIYNCNEGDIPKFVSNVTSAKQQGITVESEPYKLELKDLEPISTTLAGLYSNHIVTLYRQSDTELTRDDLPTATLTYDFSTNSISWGSEGSSNNWVISKPTGNNVFTTTATAFGKTQTDDIPPSEWATPIGLGRNGSDGYSSMTITLYQRSFNKPALPTDIITYYFEEKALSPSSALNSWSVGIPEIDENNLPCWEIHATALSKDVSDEIEVSEWSEPTKILSNSNISLADVAELIQKLEPSPIVQADISAIGFAVDRSDCAMADQQKTVTFDVVQNVTHLDFKFGEIIYPEGWTVTTDEKKVTITIPKGTKLTTEYITIPVIYKPFVQNYWYTYDLNGSKIYVTDDINVLGDFKTVSEIPSTAKEKDVFNFIGPETVDSSSYTGVFKTNVAYQLNSLGKWEEFNPQEYAYGDIVYGEETTKNMVITCEQVKGGAYLNGISSTDNIPTSPVLGDFFCWTGENTDSSLCAEGTFKQTAVYVWNGTQWAKTNDYDLNSTAMTDVLSVGASVLKENNSVISEKFDRIVSNTAIIEKLIASSAFIEALNAMHITLGYDETKQQGGVIKSSNFVSGSKGWQIDYNGNAEFSSVTMHGTVNNSDVKKGTIQEAEITKLTTGSSSSDKTVAISGGGWTDSTSTQGFGILRNGDAYFNNGDFRGKFNNLYIEANDQCAYIDFTKQTLPTSTSNQGAFSIGRNSSATLGSISLGTIVKNTGSNSISVGRQITNTGKNSTVVGYNITNSKDYVINIGQENTNSGENAISIGHDIDNAGGVSIGAFSSTKKTLGVAIGKSTTAGGMGSVSIGSSCIANDYDSIAIGASCTANENSIAIGDLCTSVKNSIAIGNTATTTLAREININNILRVVTFDAGTTYADVYDYFIKYFKKDESSRQQSATESTVMGYYGAYCVDYIKNDYDDNIDFYGVGGSNVLAATQNSTTTLKYTLRIAFVVYL